MKKTYFTSESVTDGHPDKVADQVSDAILDACLKLDENARVACETMVKEQMVVLAGEVSFTNGKNIYNLDYDNVVRDVIKDIGYDDTIYYDDLKFDNVRLNLVKELQSQSKDISIGVTETDDREQGAGDQGTMFGYACNETDELMPLPLMLSHTICKRLSEKNKDFKRDYLRPDGKAQVTVEYIDGIPCRVDDIVVSIQNSGEDFAIEAIVHSIIKDSIPSDLLDEDTKIHVNPTGRFFEGGPASDTGLTGRKIIVDTYGGMARHGGGAFSGKDASKVDRSAAYMARYISKNIVKAGICDRCEVRLSYGIGMADPTSVDIDTFGTSDYDSETLSNMIRSVFPLKPGEIISHLDLKKPIYLKTACFGHFGREEFSWEKTDKVNECLKFLEIPQ
tara:strand:- start:4783 stop:5958 length:1176 start_codon:yes stop_codon:yes gene_type:complete